MDDMSDIFFRKMMVGELIDDYYKMGRRINNILPGRKSEAEVKKNLFEMLVKMHDRIQKDITIIRDAIYRVNTAADILNSMGLTKTIGGKQVAYEKLNEKDILDKEDIVTIRVNGKDKEFKFTTIDLPTPDALLKSGDRLDEPLVYGDETERKRMKYAAKPTKRMNLKNNSAMSFGTRVINNATKKSGTGRIVNKFKK